MRQVHIHIDRLVVEGMGERDKAAFVRALERRLRAMAMDVASESGSRRMERIDAGVMGAGSNADAAAGQVVRAVGKALGKPANARPGGAGRGPAGNGASHG